MQKISKCLIICAVLVFFLSSFPVFAGGKQDEPRMPPPEEPMEEPAEELMEEPEPFDIAVFVPGVASGSPIYEQLVSGTERAAGEFGHVSVKVLEGGFNQSEWEEKIMSLAATMDYELIVTSNVAMPMVCMPVAEAFPDQKFLIVDAIIEHPQMHTVLYNQIEQAAMVGYLGGLITMSDMPGVTPDLKLGLIAGQEYAAMTEMLAPGFELGAKNAEPGITLDIRIIGNWYDANKAAELANSMIDTGVDVILTICGGANQGVISVSQERGTYVLYLDSDDYGIAPGVIAGCAVLMQDRAVFESVIAAIEGNLEWGAARILNTADGYVDFADDNPLYTEIVPEDLRAQMTEMISRLRSGDVVLEIPRFW